MQIDPKEIRGFQKKILDWYETNKRTLPWRELQFDTILQSRDPYKILLSEVMSQQTQLSRVIPKYLSWLEAFPTVQDLAKAPVAQVLHYWSGLGYNRRALNLKKTAEKIVLEYNGVFPQTEKELLQLPGIGLYTARAILCFAFNEQVAVVDTNVRKVILTQILSRHSGERSDSEILQLADSGRAQFARMTDHEIESIAQKLLPQGKAYEWNQALMDYSAAMLKNEKIPIPKQSKFIGSHRYYRGKVLKLLLDKKKVSKNKIGELLKEDFSNDDKEWLERLLDELVKERFIVIEKNTVIFA